MKKLIFDVEGDSLTPNKIWCMAIRTKTGPKATTSYDKMRDALLNTEMLIGHNITRFDVPVLERLLGITIKAKIVDTLALSWYLYPDRQKHGLEAWGEDLGIPKPEIIRWDDPNLLPEYMHRCKEDVKINTKLWKKMWEKLLVIYNGNQEKIWEFIDFLSFKMDCAREQERSGWKLDIELCTKSLEDLEANKNQTFDKLIEVMPKIPVTRKKVKPQKCYKKDGTLSTKGAIWFSLVEGMETEPDFIEVIDGYKDGNPGSSQQVKDWLFSCGWKPETFKHVKEEDGSVRQIPQVNAEFGAGICPSVKKLYEKHPEFELLEGLGVISHRISILRGFLENVDDNGYIQAQVAGLTNTLRFKHKTIVNLPKVGKPYGDIIRGCLIAPDGYELCGSDMSSLEDRLKQHFIFPHDPDYVNEMLSDDYDPHLSLALLAKAITQKQMDDYKAGIDKAIKPIRDIFKNGNYACQYGAGPPRLAMTANISLLEAKKVHATYWLKNWAIKKVAEEQEIVYYGTEMWLINPINGFAYSLRNLKDVFSTLVQGSADYVFNLWIIEFRKVRNQLTGQFHDEVVLCIKIGSRSKCEQLLRSAIETVNKQLKLNRELGIDVQFGRAYSDIH